MEGGRAIHPSRRCANATTNTDFLLNAHTFADSDCYQDCYINAYPHTNTYAYADEDTDACHTDIIHCYSIIYLPSR